MPSAAEAAAAVSHITALLAVTPVDGRYARTTQCLQNYFSEFAFFKYRVHVEVEYLDALFTDIPQVSQKIYATHVAKQKHAQKQEGSEGGEEEVVCSEEAWAVRLQNDLATLRSHLLGDAFTPEMALKIKSIEKTTNHDIKAVEYFIKEIIASHVPGLLPVMEFVHFGLTSQDINNTAIPMMLRDALHMAYLPQLEDGVVALLESKTKRTSAQADAAVPEWDAPMLARTHGQPATPTNLAKEYVVFIDRLKEQIKQLRHVPFTGKFGGATGNFNAHLVAFPTVDWRAFADKFVKDRLKLSGGRQQWTTQIEHYDNIASLCHACERIHTILVDLCRDTWEYISLGYFKQRVVAGEVGSSAMPHKVNPIDFENAEGNFLVGNAMLHFLASKLPISRLQRDLTDSTVLRNLGTPFAHGLIAFSSLQRGIKKLTVHPEALAADLEKNWAVVSEGIQTILRREGYEAPYEALKQLTRGHQEETNGASVHEFIANLQGLSDKVKAELFAITPMNYTGYTTYM